MSQEAPALNVIDLENIDAPALYSDTQAALAEMKAENDKVVFDYTTEAGLEEAGKHVWKIRRVKGKVEDRRKQLKRIALDLGKAVDEPAKQIKAELDAMIAVHQEPIDAAKQREADRKQAIQDAIDLIGESAETPTALEPPSHEIESAIARVEAIDINPEVYQERMAEATTRKAELLGQLRTCLHAASKREQEQAELERLRREAAAREQAEREERIRAEAEAKAKREAEEAAARAKAEAERREREIKEQAKRAERQAVERAERDKQQAIEDERRRQREAEEARERQAAKAKAQEEKRAANKRHRNKVMQEAAKAIDGLLENSLDGTQIVEAIVAGDIPHIDITF